MDHVLTRPAWAGYKTAEEDLIIPFSHCLSLSFSYKFYLYNKFDQHGLFFHRKLDKLNPNLNGVFHPNGLEIVSNSEVWDIRTFHLLKTVPGLDQCQVRILFILNKIL